MPTNRKGTGIKKYLKAAAKTYKEAKSYHEENFNNKVPSGEHTSKLIEVNIGLNDERLIVKPKWEVVKGESKGGFIFGDTLWLHTPGAQAFFIDWCLKIGESPIEDFEDLEDYCKSLVKKEIICNLRVIYEDEDIDMYPKNVVVTSRVENDDDDDEDAKEKKSKNTDDSENGDEVDFSQLTKKQMIAYVEDNELEDKIEDYEDLSKKELKIALENLKTDDDSGDSDDGVDLSELTKKQLIKLVEDDELDNAIPDYEDLSKKELIKAIMNAGSKDSEDDSDGGGDEVDLDFFDEFCEYTNIEPKKKDKKSKASMIKFLKNFEYTKEDKLKAKHKKFLENLGLEDLMV